MTRQNKTLAEAIRITLPIAILGLAIVGFVMLRSLKESPAAALPENPTTSVETVKVVPHSGEIKIVVTGEVVPYREVNMAAEVSGRVKVKTAICETGTFVREGDELFQIDDEDYKLEVRRLSKELEQSKAFLAELAAEIDGALRRLQVAGQEVASAEEEYKRQLNLKGIVSDSQIDKAKRDWLAARNSEIQVRNQHQLLESRKLRLISATELVDVQLDRAKLDIERTTVKSRVTGVITSEHAQKDDYVQKGETLLTIEDTSQAEITCNLDAEDEQWIWLSHPELLARRNLADEAARDYELPETQAKVIYKRGKLEYEWDGQLTRYDGLGFDPKTRTIPCRVVVKNPRQETVKGKIADPERKVGPRALVRGMYVTVELYTKPKLPLNQVPITAIQPGDLLWTVVSVGKAGGGRETVLKKRAVEVVDHLDVEGGSGKPATKMAIIYSPDNSLVANDLVVASPLSAPHDLMPVQLEGVAK